MNMNGESLQSHNTKSDRVITINLPVILQPLATFAAGGLIAAAIFFTPKTAVVSNTVGAAGTGATVSATNSTEPAVSLDTIRGLFQSQYIQIGNADSKLLIVEVGDPSCSYCQLAGGKYPELNKQAGGQFLLTQDGGSFVAPGIEIHKLVEQGLASYVYIYFPGGKNGDVAMQAIYCAHEQGKFWQAHDFLMSKSGVDVIRAVGNDSTKSAEMAAGLSHILDQTFVKDCIDSGKYKNRLSTDYQTAIELGVGGTPGFFLNNTLFPGAISWTEMQSEANKALNQ